MLVPAAPRDDTDPGYSRGPKWTKYDPASQSGTYVCGQKHDDPTKLSDRRRGEVKGFRCVGPGQSEAGVGLLAVAWSAALRFRRVLAMMHTADAAPSTVKTAVLPIDLFVELS